MGSEICPMTTDTVHIGCVYKSPALRCFKFWMSATTCAQNIRMSIWKTEIDVHISCFSTFLSTRLINLSAGMPGPHFGFW